MTKVQMVLKLMISVRFNNEMGWQAHDQASKLVDLSNKMKSVADTDELRKGAEEIYKQSLVIRKCANNFDNTAGQAAELGYDVWKTMNDKERKIAWTEYAKTGIEYNDCPPAFRDAAPLPDVVRVDCNSKR